LRSIKEGNYEEIPENYFEEGDQLSNILDKEKHKILAGCLKNLKPNLKEYITYWFDNPRGEAKVVAQHFGISVNNAWTKKHRIISTLKECVEKRLAA
jgi:DNA-directed RNA polymerase specialized sigma24 family protein